MTSALADRPLEARQREASVTFNRPAVSASVRSLKGVIFGTASSVAQVASDDWSSARSIQRLTVTGRFEEMMVVLIDALRSAVRCRFELPSPQAINRAEAVVRAAAGSAATIATIATFDAAIGEDGTIELTATPAGRSITLDISPNGAKTEMVVRDALTRERLALESFSADSGFVKWFER